VPSHGLSYSTFTLSDLAIETDHATLTVRNNSELAGAETIQLYISPDSNCSIRRPEKELKGFSKVFLQPGESRQVEIQFDRFTTAFWDEELKAWVCEKGEYKVLVGTSSRSIALEGVLSVKATTTWTGL
jgi:beta-glucosidase